MYHLVYLHYIGLDLFCNIDETVKTPRMTSRVTPNRSVTSRVIDRARNSCLISCARAASRTFPLSVWAEMQILLFFSKGKRLPSRRFIVRGEIKTEKTAQRIPHGASIVLREETVGVDSSDFFVLGTKIVKSVQYLTANGLKALLTHDMYNTHISLAVLKLLCAHRIIMNAPPIHMSGKTQTFDVIVFSVYKLELNATILCMTRAVQLEC